MASIVIADDHEVVRTGVRLLVERETDMRVVAEAASGSEVMRLVVELCPDIVVLDLSLPDMHGLDVIRELTAQCPATRIVVLSMHSSEAYAAEALHSGASAYVLKESAASDLVEAIRTVAAGGRYLSPPLSRIPVDERPPVPASYESLSPRERQILRLLIDGHTNARIAELLSISRRTVEAHRAQIMTKLSLTRPADLIKFAVRYRLISLDARPRDNQ